MSRLAIDIVLFVMCCIFLPQVALAEPTYDEHGDLIRPDAERSSGILEAVGPETGGVSLIVINDTKYRVDIETVYRNKSGRKSNLLRFSKGMLVDFYAIQHLVTNLSMSTNPDENSDEGQKNLPLSSVPAQSEIRQEDGVWKN